MQEYSSLTLSTLNSIIKRALRQPDQQIQEMISNLSISLKEYDPGIDRNSLLMPYKDEILEIINRKFDINFNYMYENLYQIALLISFGIEWPEFKEILNDYKVRIIKAMLQLIKKGDREVEYYLYILIKLAKLDWHELEIIKRSVDTQLFEHELMENTAMMSVTYEQVSELNLNLDYVQKQAVVNSLNSLLERLGKHNSLVAARSTFQLLEINYQISVETLAKLFALVETQVLEDVELKLKSDKVVYAILDLTILFFSQETIDRVLNKYKDHVLKYLLVQIRDLKIDSAQTVLRTLTRELNVNWPEIAVIEKSINNKPKTALQESELLDKLIKFSDSAIDKLVPENISSFYQFARSLEANAMSEMTLNPNNNAKALIAQVMYRHKRKLLEYLDSLINSSAYAVQISGIFALTVFKKFNLNWPELQQIIDKKVPNIVNSYIENYDNNGVIKILDAVKTIGVPREKIKVGYKDAIKQIIHDINEILDENPVNFALRYKFNLFDRIGVDFKFKNGSLKRKLTTALDHYMSQNGLYDGTSVLIELMMKYTADHSAMLSEIAEIVNKNKQSVIKRLLMDIKNDNTYNISDYLKTLKLLQLNWPELDVITASIGSTLNEALQDDLFDRFYLESRLGFLTNDIEEGNYDSVIWHLFKIGNRPDRDRAKNMSKLFDVHKTEIFKEFLINVKQTELLNLDASDLFIILNGFKAVGVAWPELDVVSRSLNAELLNESLNVIDANNALNVLFGLAGVRQNVPRSWDRIAFEQFLEDNKSKFLETIKQYIEFEDYKISVAIFMILGLQFYGKDWSELHDLLDQQKDSVIKMLLTLIKHQGVTNYTLDALTGIKAMGFNWPELDIMIKHSQKFTD